MSSHNSAENTVLTAQRLSLLATKFPEIHDSWYFVAAACFSICNKPSEISRILHLKLLQETYNDNDAKIDISPGSHVAQLAEKAIQNASHIVNSDTAPEWPTLSEKIKESQKLIQIVDVLKESLLKSAPLGGLPKAINSLTVLKNATPSNLRTAEPKRPSIDTQEDFDKVSLRGLKFWDTVYGKVATRIKSQMRLAYPDLINWTLQLVYAPILSFTDVLSEKHSSFVIIACLIPQDVNPQLKGHLRGALNNGATLREISQVREMALLITEWCGVLLHEPAAKL